MLDCTCVTVQFILSRYKELDVYVLKRILIIKHLCFVLLVLGDDRIFEIFRPLHGCRESHIHFSNSCDFIEASLWYRNRTLSDLFNNVVALL